MRLQYNLSSCFLPAPASLAVETLAPAFLSVLIVRASALKTVAWTHCIYQPGSSCREPECLSFPLVRAEGGRRHGYMGHLTRIANCVVHSTDKGPNSVLVQQLIRGEWFVAL